MTLVVEALAAASAWRLTQARYNIRPAAVDIF